MEYIISKLQVRSAIIILKKKKHIKMYLYYGFYSMRVNVLTNFTWKKIRARFTMDRLNSFCPRAPCLQSSTRGGLWAHITTAMCAQRCRRYEMIVLVQVPSRHERKRENWKLLRRSITRSHVGCKKTDDDHQV